MAAQRTFLRVEAGPHRGAAEGQLAQRGQRRRDAADPIPRLHTRRAKLFVATLSPLLLLCGDLISSPLTLCGAVRRAV